MLDQNVLEDRMIFYIQQMGKFPDCFMYKISMAFLHAWENKSKFADYYEFHL